MRSSRALVKLAAGLAAATLLAAGARAAEVARTGGPYVPTPQVVVDAMLRMANVGPADFVVDLGSGDGIIVLTAARKHKARGFGVDIDPDLVKQSNNEARRSGVADRAQFFVQDVFKADIGKATVVTLYLLPAMMVNLRPKIFNELRPGTRVVSHDYHFAADWPPDAQFTFDVPEKEMVNGVGNATVFLWIVPAKIGGRWRIRVAAPSVEHYDVMLRQSYQNIDGTVSADGGNSGRLLTAQLRGEEVAFTFPAALGRHVFKGRAVGNAMQGSVELAGGKGVAKWTAFRQ
jgi:phospholipid N-methyltransferase